MRLLSFDDWSINFFTNKRKDNEFKLYEVSPVDCLGQFP